MRMSKMQRLGLLAVFVLTFAGVGVFVVSNSSAASANCTYGTYGPGYTTYGGGAFGDCVKRLQTVYNEWAFNSTGNGSQELWSVDNSYGQKTYNAIKYFQSRNGLSQDGITGTNTWYKMCQYLHSHRLPYDEIGCYRWGLN